MKALVFETPDAPVLQDVPVPKITENEILVRLLKVGICHSDYELLAGRYIIPISYPVTPGHEWCGEIVETGRNVQGFHRGERVVGECVVRLPDRIHHFGFSLNGADREYFVVRPEWLHKLPDTIDDGTASLIEPFTCGFYAVQRSGGTNASETVVVSGGGTIGLVSAAAAIGMGARVIVIDPIASRRDAALKLEAAEVIDPLAGNTIDQVMALTQGKGADLVVEASGHDASLGLVFDLVREEGRLSMVGINIGRMVSSHLGNIQMRNLTVRGCIGSPGVWPAAIRFLERTKLDLSPIRTHEFPLSRSIEAFALGSQADKCIKVTLSND
ncbi:zinc-binding dehydrogenase [Acidisoma cellulosilytica]|uniref:Zinc-binding dehydrogenase n=1 Tax=Acidisoma cellulosilyticum TaxID=2802395 RepID=A0A964E4A6_9PROT|nr:zinc-binding dehydrogenase [Acidisoma cellulosilyticum]MCB8881490.1 zinc-binding dehydrogenase [Acidisoma cellulosilyticum]